MNLFDNRDPSVMLNSMKDLIGEDWMKTLDSNIVMDLGYVLDDIKEYERVNNVKAYPEHNICLRSLNMIKPNDVKAVIISKCPYPNYNADGIPFSCSVDYSESLKQIYFACHKDNGIIKTGSIHKYSKTLDHWVDQGILLLNRKHRVLEDNPNSFANSNWDSFIENIVKSIHNTIDKSIPFFAWGSEAATILKKVDKDLKSKHFTYYTEEHPISASRNLRYWMCNHFDIINKYLNDNNKTVIKW